MTDDRVSDAVLALLADPDWAAPKSSTAHTYHRAAQELVEARAKIAELRIERDALRSRVTELEVVTCVCDIEGEAGGDTAQDYASNCDVEAGTIEEVMVSHTFPNQWLAVLPTEVEYDDDDDFDFHGAAAMLFDTRDEAEAAIEQRKTFLLFGGHPPATKYEEDPRD